MRESRIKGENSIGRPGRGYVGAFLARITNQDVTACVVNGLFGDGIQIGVEL